MSRRSDACTLAPIRLRSFDGVRHGISTRHGGTSKGPYTSLNLRMSKGDREEYVLENRRRFFSNLGLRRSDVMIGRLSHKNEVSVFAGNKSGEHPYSIESVRPGSRRRELAFFSDAVISNVPGTNFMITAADCVPLAFADRSRNAIGAAHAGWRGTALSIASEVVHAMLRAFQSEPQDLIVGIGPSVGPCCYAVDEGVVRSFAENGHNPVIEKRGGKTYLDLWTTNALQLASAGVSAESIEICRICTSCNVQHYFSHRAEAGRTGRFALCIGL
ncbi:MAG: peptidoglycan editing factor PgeF [Chloroflexota bacterium]